jgi:GNAT superfamily N-acetyltransferase
MDTLELAIVEAQLDRREHQEAIVSLTAAYAEDVMGNGKPLPPDVLERLDPGLRAHPTTLVFLAYLEGAPVGIATCFLGFSTFAARPLVNVHDLAVVPERRGIGIGRALLHAVDAGARARGCAKVTLEVLANNLNARKLYESEGFAQAAYSPTGGGALFYSKSL